MPVMSIVNFMALTVTGALHLFLGFLGFQRAPERNVGRNFCLLMISVSIWIFGLAFLIVARTELAAMWATRLHMLGPIFVPYFFHRFVIAFRKDIAHELPRGWKWFYGILIPAFLICAPTSWLIRTASVWGTPTVIGPAYWPFGAYILIGMGNSIRLLGQYARKAISPEKVRVIYLLIAVSIGSAVGVGANLLLRLAVNMGSPLHNDDRFTAIGPIGSLIMAVIIVYAILKHQLMDIKVIVRLTVVYGILGAKSWPGIEWEGPKRFRENDRQRIPPE